MSEMEKAYQILPYLFFEDLPAHHSQLSLQNGAIWGFASHFCPVLLKTDQLR